MEKVEDIQLTDVMANVAAAGGVSPIRTAQTGDGNFEKGVGSSKLTLIASYTPLYSPG